MDEQSEKQFKKADEFVYDQKDEYMDSTMLRDQNFESNHLRMTECKRSFNMTRYFGFFSSIAIGLYSALMFAITVVNLFYSTVTQAAINETLPPDEQIHNVIDFSGWFATIPIMTVIAVCSMLSGEYHKKKANAVLYIAHVLFAVLGLLTLLGVCDDMPKFAGIPMIVYAVIGFRNTDRTQVAINEDLFLQTQEGYPEFNLGMYYMHDSKYKRMREEWEKKEKKYDFYGEKARPAAAMISYSDDGGMDGLSVDDAEREKWFADNVEEEPVLDENKIDP